MSSTLAAYIELLSDKHEPVLDSASAPQIPLNMPFAGRISALLLMHASQTLLIVLSWLCVGSGALSGRLDFGWLSAWALALATTIPLSMACQWLEGVIAIGVSVRLKRGLLLGAMGTDPDVIRAKGAGELLGETLEADSIDALTATAGISVGLALVELLIFPVLLIWGAAAQSEILVLVAFVGFALLLLAGNLRQRASWTRRRIALTNRLVENMTANRSRLAQQAPQYWHDAEDADLEEYVLASRRLDDSTMRLAVLLTRAYVIVALGALFPVFLSGSASLPQLAITLGIIISTASSLANLSEGLTQIGEAWVAWRLVQPTWNNAPLPAAPAWTTEPRADCRCVIHAQDVHFSHRGRLGSVLNGCDLKVERGDQIILEGSSGGGKSTLATILAGLRLPSSGVILVGGLDQFTLGEQAWRRRIVLAPQYHENHLFSASLSFNLLLGRPLPHSQQDLYEALDLCRELGLGPLIDSMPAGMEQLIGDTGWRVSQGERSRIFLARALLQHADLLVLDESLAALDPENLQQCMRCIQRRAPTLMLIAHP